MSANVSASFIAQYSNDVKHAYQQKQPRLLQHVRQALNVTGSTYNFHTMGSVVANTKTRDADITPLNPTQAQVTATLGDYYAGIYIDKLDELKTNIDLRKEKVIESATAISKKIDDVLITSLDAATNTTATTAGGLTYAKLLELVTYFNASDVDFENRILVIGAKQLTEALNITQLTSADYTTVRSVMTGQPGNILGMQWVLSNRLPLNTTNRTCFAFDKNAIGCAIGQDLKTRIDYSVDKAADLILTTVSLGSVIIDQKGVTKFICAES